MTAAQLKKWDTLKRSMYIDLVKTCGSVPELLIRLEIYGQKWTRWDWVLFFKYLYVHSMTLVSANPGEPVEELVMLNDIFKTLDDGNALDSVFTDKVVVLSFVEYLNFAYFHSKSPFMSKLELYGVFSLLAHVFKKFPDMWKMNWMFARKRSGGKKGERVHRLAAIFAEESGLSRPREYYISQAFYDDFVHMNYSKIQVCSSAST